MKLLDYVKMINGFFSGLLSAGILGYVMGVTRNNVSALLQGLTLIVASAPVVVFSAFVWYFIEKENGKVEIK